MSLRKLINMAIQFGRNIPSPWFSTSSIGFSGYTGTDCGYKRLLSTGSNGSSGSTGTDCESYTVLPNQKGLVIIINDTTNREGAEKDYNNIHTFFKKTLKYDEEYIENPTLKNLKKFLEKITSRIESKANKYFGIFVFIMGHGDKDDQIKVQGDVIPVDYIINYFKNDKMKKFAGKPKSFFIQACRGSSCQDGIAIDGIDPLVPADADILKFYATTSGHAAHRVMAEGTWFILDMITVFKDGYRCKHLESMCIEIKNKVSKRSSVKDKKQMPIVVSTLRKELYLTYQDKK